MKLIRKIAKKRTPLLILLTAVVVVLGVYFFYLLKQVEVAFEASNEFIPTRIYSRVTKIAPPQARGAVEHKLHALGYNPKVQANDVSIVLHSPHYPDYLLPPDHPTLKLKDKSITLHFEGTTPDSPLGTIDSEDGAVNEFYLEPEFIATLSSDKSQIRENLKFDEFPKAIPDAVLAAEDNHFYEHFGIDPRGFARAILVDIKTLSLSQGGSTVTQQLVKNLME